MRRMSYSCFNVQTLWFEFPAKISLHVLNWLHYSVALPHPSVCRSFASFSSTTNAAQSPVLTEAAPTGLKPQFWCQMFILLTRAQVYFLKVVIIKETSIDHPHRKQVSMDIKTTGKQQATQANYTDVMYLLLWQAALFFLTCLPGRFLWLMSSMFASWTNTAEFRWGPQGCCFLHRKRLTTTPSAVSMTINQHPWHSWLMTSKNSSYLRRRTHQYCQTHGNAGPTSWFDFQNTRMHMSQCPPRVA